MCLKADGIIRSFRMDQSNLNQYFDYHEYGFCGAIRDLNIVAVARTIHEDYAESNRFTEMFPDYFEPACGDILLLGSDEDGNACDVDVEKAIQILT